MTGRGGGTGAAPLIFRDHISVPTIPAPARACGHDALSGVGPRDLPTQKGEMADLSGPRFAGVGAG